MARPVVVRALLRSRAPCLGYGGQTWARQLSALDGRSCPPAVTDLEGLLSGCALVRGRRPLSVGVADAWRADALQADLAVRRPRRCADASRRPRRPYAVQSRGCPGHARGGCAAPTSGRRRVLLSTGAGSGCGRSPRAGRIRPVSLAAPRSRTRWSATGRRRLAAGVAGGLRRAAGRRAGLPGHGGRRLAGCVSSWGSRRPRAGRTSGRPLDGVRRSGFRRARDASVARRGDLMGRFRSLRRDVCRLGSANCCDGTARRIRAVTTVPSTDPAHRGDHDRPPSPPDVHPACSAADRAAGNGNGDGTRLVIVESPAKAKTIAGYLGAGLRRRGSVGHIRDLPRNAADIPAECRRAALGPARRRRRQRLRAALRRQRRTSRQQVAELKRCSRTPTSSTSPRTRTARARPSPGTCVEMLKPQGPGPPDGLPRDHPAGDPGRGRQPADIDSRLVDAQETRRILDRLYGYEVCPVLWRKVMPGLSAGRVQSVATRLVVERERERMAFRAAAYWDIEGDVRPPRAGQRRDFTADAGRRRRPPGRHRPRLRRGRPAWLRRRRRCTSTRRRRARDRRALADAPFAVRWVEEKPYRRRPAAPFITSTLQQEAGRKLRFSASTTMQRGAAAVRERLHHLHAHRLDDAVARPRSTAARSQARELYGDDYVPAEPRRYERKVKNAQEAHEAIRPAGDTLPHAGPGRGGAVGARSSRSTS